VHDEADRKSGQRIARPLPTLWSSLRALSSWYAEAGGPPALWRAWGSDVQGRALNAGHFFPEEIPDETADALDCFSHATS
jgi:haloacetate dehalogenase